MASGWGGDSVTLTSPNSSFNCAYGEIEHSSHQVKDGSLQHPHQVALIEGGAADFDPGVGSRVCHLFIFRPSSLP